MLSFGRTEVLGLDIGSSAVKVVRLRKEDTGYAVTAAGIAEIVVSDDNDEPKINTVKAIRQCFESLAVKTKLAVCGVSGPEVAARDFEFPSLQTEEIEGAVLLEASQVCPFNAADSAVDYHLIPNGDDRIRGVLVAATNALIKSKIQLAKEASLKCVLMDVDGLALLNCFNGLGNESEKSTTAILNVGSSYTTLAVMSEDGRPFIRDMTCAGDDIIKQIAAENRMSPETVKRALSADSTASQTELQGSLEKACQKLIIDVSKTLRYYAAQEKSMAVEKIFVCGGFALARGFVQFLNSRLGVEAVLWNPFEKMRCEAAQGCADILDNRGPAMAVAAGLAMRSI